MLVGHVCLLKDSDAAGEQLLHLAEALGKQGIRQHVAVRSASLAGQLAGVEDVTVGPLVSSPGAAFCTIPAIDIAHLHDTRSLPVGLLLALTRSIPFITMYRDDSLPSDRAVIQLAYRRASSIVCLTNKAGDVMQTSYPKTIIDIVPDVSDLGREEIDPIIGWQRMAADYAKIYRRSLDDSGVPAMLL